MASTRSRVLLGIALLASAGLVGGATVALVNSSDDKGSTTKAISTPSAVPTTEPTPTPEPAPEVTLTPTPTPTATPSATPSASATATPSATATATSSATTRTYAYPKPTRGYEGLRLAITLSRSTGYPSTLFGIKLASADGTGKTTGPGATDGDGQVYFGGLNWGDGTTVAADASPVHCKSFPSPTAQPGPYTPQPSSLTTDYKYRHNYAAPGTYHATLTVISVNADCRPYGPTRESRSLPVTITITAEPTPSPTATTQ